MSWFYYGDPKNRQKRKGIWLRTQTVPEDVKGAIKDTRCLRASESIDRIEVHEMRDNDLVLLRIWAKSIADSARKINRYNVFFVIVKENPEWICEGDLGRGLK